VHAIVQHADRRKHRARNEAVGNHLDESALNTDRIEDEEPESHETHVGDRRIGHQLLHVGLNECHKTDVNHGDQRQRDDHGASA
jgi:hypothetical protein